ncbi:NAD(P)/FAD-dependent oxidoreductase [Pandoraea sp. PE-S2R-1]|uniref:FAD-dependent oxidoreductase n=1 Tax=Pandoraea sp. PE-S2R-1 TaxID=1986994 RepID=UPI0014824E90|nr:FAD-dependent monooxygenase [Pandoraea sp. PE-S2R-1]
MSALHVTIIGAGLGGLCLAQGLRRAGIPFDVFERDSAPAARFQGYRLRIDANGFDAIDQCLPDGQAQRLRQHAAVARNGGHFVTPALDDADVVLPPSWHESHTESPTEPAVVRHPAPQQRRNIARAKTHDGAPPGDLSMHRQTLREILLDGILDHVHFGKTFTHTTRTADGQRVAHFEDGTCSVPGLVVAADGTHSRVREHLLPGMTPRDTGNVCFYGLTPVSTALLVLMDSHGEATLMEGSTVVFADGFAVVVDAMLFRRESGTGMYATPNLQNDGTNDSADDAARMPLSPVSDYLYWAFIGPSQALLGREGMAAEASGLVPLAHIDTLTRRWHPHLRSLFAHAVPDTVRTMPVRSTASPLPWQLDGVTGLGDAVHTMSPAGGLGANTALSDAAMLTRHLQAVAAGEQPLAQALTAYERDMCERAREAVRLADAAAAMLNARRAAPHEAAPTSASTSADAVHL